MTNEKILQIAMQQSAVDASCCASDFCSEENKVVFSAEARGARKYLSLPFYCNLISYGSNIVAAVDPQIAPAVRSYLARYPVEHCFETPNLHVLDAALKTNGYKVCFMAEYFLPDLNLIHLQTCQYSTRLLQPQDFASYYLPEWSNALCESRRQLDCLAVGAFDGETLVGLAGCSADCDTMWQIGVDVLPAYRRKGIAAAVTSKLAIEILQRGIVPFYCAAWSNIRSVRNALRCGLKPAWVELTAKPESFVHEMNFPSGMDFIDVQNIFSKGEISNGSTACRSSETANIG